MSNKPPEATGLATGLVEFVARVLLIACGALLIVVGTMALIEQWPEPSWILAVLIAGGVGGVWTGTFDSPAAVLKLLLPWP
ncbi:MAG TPA: hypothetical protein VD867_03270 [Burkholderiales bacterium]|nr:hypothetical protein [Burkholderiales bacterium]